MEKACEAWSTRTTDGLRNSLGPSGEMDVVSERFPAKPLMPVAWMVELAEDPTLTVIRSESEDSRKSTAPTLMWILWVRCSLTAVRLTVKFPDSIGVTVKETVPELVRLTPLNVAVRPGEVVWESVTVPVNPLTAETVIVEVLDAPRSTWSFPGLAVTRKSTTLTNTTTECDMEPLEPVTVTL